MSKTKKQTKTKQSKPRLSRVDLVRTSTDETIGVLEKKLRNAKRKVGKLTHAPLAALRIADKVFQWRRGGYDLISSDDHVLNLAKALQNAGKPLEPILVFPVGPHLYVVDGHHRVDAYRTVKWSRRVPVEVFRGTLNEARIEAFRRNSKDKLPMSKQDKMEGTWTLVKEVKMTVESLSNITGASERQIFFMRKVWKWLGEMPKERREQLRRGVRELTWKQARDLFSDQTPDLDLEEWKEKKVEKLVQALLKAKIGQGLSKHPDVTAMALERINSGLPAALVHEWFRPSELREMVDEIGKLEPYEL